MDDEGPQHEAAFRLAIPRPPAGERRVPLDPDTVSRLVQQGWAITIEQGAGDLAGFPDAAFEAQGATIVASKPDLHDADVLLVTSLPDDPCLSANDHTAADRATDSDDTSWVEMLRRAPTIIGLLNPLDHLDDVREWSERGQTAFSLDLMPRASRSLLADATASQGSLAGYRGAVLAAAALDRTVPLLVLPAGSLPPARFLIVGSDPIGLQAAITAHRLGAIVEVYDPRASEREVVESIGATFIGGDIVTETGDRPSRAEAARRQQLLLAHHARHADAIILAAITPGRPAPKLVSEEAVESMRPGSVIVDLAAPWGGNCALTRPGEELVLHQVTILGPLNPAADLAHQASTLLAHNVEYFLTLLAATGALPIRIEDADPAVRAACVVDHGEVHYRPARSRLGLSPVPAAATDESAELPFDETATASAFAAAPRPAESTTENRRSGRLRHSMSRFGRRHEEAPAKPGPATTAATTAHLAGSDEIPRARADEPDDKNESVAREAAAPTGPGSAPTTATFASRVPAEMADHDPVMADAEHAEEAQREETLAWTTAAAPDAAAPQPADEERDITHSPPPADFVSPSMEEPSEGAPPAATPVSAETAPSEEAPEPIPLSGQATLSTTDAATVEISDTQRAAEAHTVTPAPGATTDTASTPVPNHHDQPRPTEETQPANERQPAESTVTAAIEQSPPSGESPIETSEDDRPEQVGASSPPAFVPGRDDATGTYEPMPTDDVIDDAIPPLSDSTASQPEHAPWEPTGPVGIPLPPSEPPTRPPGWGEWSSTSPRATANPTPPEEPGSLLVPSNMPPAEVAANPSDVPDAEPRPTWAPFLPRAEEKDSDVPTAAFDAGETSPSAPPEASPGTESSAAASEISPHGANDGEESENAKLLRWRPWRRPAQDHDRH